MISRSIGTALMVVMFVTFAAAAFEKKGLVGGLRPIPVGDVPKEAVSTAYEAFDTNVKDDLERERNSIFMLSKPVIAHAESQVSFCPNHENVLTDCCMLTLTCHNAQCQLSQTQS